MTSTPVSSAARPFRFYAGLFLLTCCTLMLEIIQTRLLSVATWYHLAFFVISSAMFGMTAGAVWIYLRRSRYTPATLSHDLATFTTAFAVSTALCLAFQVTLAPAMVQSAALVIVFTELAIAIALPFFFSGAAVSLALTRSPFPVGRVYAVDLAGAALGCLGVLAVLEWTDGPSAILLIGAGAAGAAMLFAGSGIGAAVEPRDWIGRLARPRIVFVVLLALGIANGLTINGIQPIFVKGRVETRGSNWLAEEWNCFSRIVVIRRGMLEPGLWGASSRLPPGPVEQVSLDIDGAAGTTMFAFGGDPKQADFLRYDLTNLAYHVRSSGRAAVIGVGGGRDVLSAWVFGLRDVTGVELNPIFIDLLTRDPMLSRFAGLSSLPGVKLEVDEARSWMSRTNERFDVIQMSMIDTWAATGAGAFTLTENGLYTVEAWNVFLHRLTDTGLFTVSRWHAPGEINETGRMMSLAMAALLASGVPDPIRHLYLASSTNIATLVLSRAPLTDLEIARLNEVCGRLGFRVLLSPGEPAASEVLRTIVTAASLRDLQARTEGLTLDLTPPTDDRPFFFNLLPLHKPHLAFRNATDTGVVGGNILATLTLVTILLISVALVTLTIVLPLRGSIREVGGHLVAGGTSFFALLGLGFMFVEMGLLQRLSVFLGHPVYSLSIALFSVILTTGLGSWLSEKLQLRSAWRLALWAGLLAAYVGSMAWWMPRIFEAYQTAGIGTRGGLALLLITPAGLLMGFGFPTGMRMVAAHDPRPTPWLWGINGAAGVLASVLSVALSITFGIHVTLFLGALCYLALIPAALVIGFPRRLARATS